MEMNVSRSLECRLESLRNDFLLAFGETEENELFLKQLESFSNAMKGNVDFQIADCQFKELLFEVKNKLFGDSFIREYEHSNILLQTSILDRINSTRKIEILRKNQTTKIKFENDKKEREEFFDNQMFENLENSISYIKILKLLGINTIDKKSLGWGNGGGGAGSFSKNTESIFNRYIEIIERDKSLIELAEKIGKHSQSRYSKGVDGKIKPSVSYDGIYNSDNLRTILPSELSMKSNPKTRQEFLRKYAERQLLCYHPAPDRSAADGNDKEKGPVIICLDTSGSMHGIPEAVSKAITLAIVRKVANENRAVYIISFAVDFESLKIEHLEKSENTIKLADFLASSFHGGTDMIPALEHATKTLGEKNFTNADILMVSDFVSSDFPESTKKLFQKVKRKGTRFFALSIGNNANSGILSLFDKVTFYSKENFI